MPRILDCRLIHERLGKDRPWTAYALADLEPGPADHASWFCAQDGSGLVLLYREFAKPIVFCIERSEQLASILKEIDLACCGGSVPNPKNSGDRVLVVRPDDAPLMYSLYRITEERRMIRMVLDTDDLIRVPGGNATRLGPAHLEKVQELYGEERPEFYYDRLLSEGVFFGIFEGSALAAIAGTHILSSRFGVACIGNVYTRPASRRQGYAGFATSAVSRELRAKGIATIILNVREENSAAVRTYEKIGYRRYRRYIELNAIPESQS